ncbi:MULTISPECIES: FprA family A-type flavoprotein [unclassified Candidatus Frackibacter]|uniref:FprA family A-type flavoprotein n=1 Tax=unclassified Candidatus Frackibacter TaxID=2648818 RepID=UPI000797C586|nr:MULTISPECIES: flavodoxin domain-containing protein [unclassified Candidatus Frackibacter]KXS45124.1 MAG: putative flavoprotein [Candidatus Frackibacter sp. T328-2]SDC47416.1 Flavorubredoxin [Candidatus Frackibacter sp. WG11]SEM81270.1 Flavorubredoxin [Candidatus Frackibacter sp. WG12]SFL72775.1 Flavorubredoxin [Candidatus Frackibacter sp. WG13]
MSIFQVKEDVYWVGARDWNINSFHGPAYSTKQGTTYNSYLIKDEKNVLVDGVYKPFIDRFFEHIEEVVDFKDIDYYIVNHVEPDHSSSFPRTMERLRDDVTVVCSAKGKEGIIEHYGSGYNFEVVSTGDTINIGERNLAFVDASMLHWPDSMFTYIPEDKLLLPNDAFGMHYCTSQLFDDQVDDCLMMDEAKKYFANILTPFSSILLKKLKEVQEMDIEIDMIAPSHGIIWREDPNKIIQKYLEWAEGKAKEKALVIYETMWDSTELMAKKIADGLIDQGIEVQFYRKSDADKNDIIKEFLDAKAIIVGSPTINNVMIPELTPLLEELEGLRFKNKLGASFGSYGWRGGAAKRIADRLEGAKIELIDEPLEVKYVPDKEQLKECYEFGVSIAEKIKQS